MNLQETEKMYSEILCLIKNKKDDCIFNIDELEKAAKIHLFGLKLRESYGLNIDPKKVNSMDWISLGSHCKIGWFGKNYDRRISWSDDGSQPEDELMLMITFPTGAYIFGDDYPLYLFRDFFSELKQYAPKYLDTRNASLYFPIETASPAFNNFDRIFRKYYEINEKESKQRKIEKMEQDLISLKLQNK